MSTASGIWTSSRRLAPRPYPRGPMAKTTTPRCPRRPLPPLLPPAVVSRRDRRVPHPCAVAGVPDKRGLPRALDRQRRGHDRRRDRRGARAALGHRASHDALPYSPEQKRKARNRSGDRSKGVCSPCSRESPSWTLALLNTWRPRHGSKRSISAKSTRRSTIDSARAVDARPQRRSRIQSPTPTRLRRAFRTEVSAQAAPKRRHRHRRGGALRSPSGLLHTLATTGSVSLAGILASIDLVDTPLGRAPRDLAAPRQGAKRRAHSARRHPRTDRTGARAPSASPPTCAGSWPTTPPTGLPPALPAQTRHRRSGGLAEQTGSPCTD